MRPLALSALLLLAACGGSPAGPSSAPPTTLPAPSARDGATGAAITATFATTAGTVTATAPGYLPRVQRLTADPLFLWPQDEAYVRAIVYGNTTAILYRWTRASVTVQVDQQLVRPASSALADIHEATGISFGFIDAGGDIVMRFDPDDPYFADKPNVSGYTQSKVTPGGAITSALIVFRTQNAVDLATLHELGHAVGLTHSNRIDDVMWPTTDRTFGFFSDRERVVLRMMYQHRESGNMPPDREAGAAATGGLRTIIVSD